MNVRLNNSSWCLPLLALFLSGCLSSPHAPLGYFREPRQVDAVLQFSGWDYTFLVEPAYRVNGFYEPVRRDNASLVFDHMRVRRNVAVVIIGWTYRSGDLAAVVAEWKSVLENCGFKRVVFVRPAGRNLYGAPLIEDATLFSSAAQDNPVRSF